MKAETQAVHLEKMMQKHTLYPEYELALSPVQLKKNSIKKLSKGDILLLGLDNLNMILIDEGEIRANVVMNKSENSSKLRITQLNMSTIGRSNSKKYETMVISFGMIQIRKLEVGHTLGVSSLKLQEVTLWVEDKNIAKGSLVKVDEEIAVQIDEVKR